MPGLVHVATKIRDSQGQNVKNVYVCDTAVIFVSSPYAFPAQEGVLTFKGIRGCATHVLLFHQISLDMGLILVKKSLEEGPNSQKLEEKKW